MINELYLWIKLEKSLFLYYKKYWQKVPWVFASDFQKNKQHKTVDCGPLWQWETSKKHRNNTLQGNWNSYTHWTGTRLRIKWQKTVKQSSFFTKIWYSSLTKHRW